jgi:hypothetical protein
MVKKEMSALKRLKGILNNTTMSMMQKKYKAVTLKDNPYQQNQGCQETQLANSNPQRRLQHLQGC